LGVLGEVYRDNNKQIRIINYLSLRTSDFSKLLSDFLTYWFDVAQAVGGIATAGALVFVALQTRQTRNQTEIMREQLGRAYLGAAINPVTKSPDIAYYKQRNMIHLTLKNYGQPPANVLCYLSEVTSKKEITEEEIRKSIHSSPPINQTIFPTVERPADVYLGDTISADVKENITFIGVIFQYGYYKFKDQKKGEYGFIIQIQGNTWSLHKEWGI
jgi:hypothetical protein